jgi:transcriptional regulator
MKDQETKNRFVELRAKGWSYDRIAQELKTTKQTLISWSKELSLIIENLRAIELETIQEKYFAMREKRIEIFGETLKAIRKELDQRDLKDIPTDKLFSLLLKYSEALKGESLETVFSAEEDSSVEALLGDFKRVATWKG